MVGISLSVSNNLTSLTLRTVILTRLHTGHFHQVIVPVCASLTRVQQPPWLCQNKPFSVKTLSLSSHTFSFLPSLSFSIFSLATISISFYLQSCYNLYLFLSSVFLPSLSLSIFSLSTISISFYLQSFYNLYLFLSSVFLQSLSLSIFSLATISISFYLQSFYHLYLFLSSDFLQSLSLSIFSLATISISFYLQSFYNLYLFPSSVWFILKSRSPLSHKDF